MTCYAAFDVGAIHDYVFGAVRPIDVMGASRIVREFEERAKNLASEAGAKPRFVGGGSGLFELPGDLASAEQLARRLEEDFADATSRAATCTAVAVASEGDFRSDHRRLADALARRKTSKWLHTASQTFADERDPRRLCRGCGIEPVTHTDKLGGTDTEEIGDFCRRRREAGRRGRRDGELPQALSLEDLLGDSRSTDARDAGHKRDPRSGSRKPEPEDGQRRRLLAVVYLDADRAGERLMECSDAGELEHLSGLITSGSTRALEETVADLDLEGKFLAPIVGGDDVLVIAAADYAADLLRGIWLRLSEYVTSRTASGGRAGLSSSAAVVMADRHVPLRLMFTEAEEALREAKQASYAHPEGEPHCAVRCVGRPRRAAPTSGLVFGAPLPRSCWVSPDGDPPLVRLFEHLAALPSAQRNGLLVDLEERSPKVRALSVDYRASRAGPHLAAALELAREIAGHAPGSASFSRGVGSAVGAGSGAGAPGASWSCDPWRVLAGGVLAVDVGWVDAAAAESGEGGGSASTRPVAEEVAS